MWLDVRNRVPRDKAANEHLGWLEASVYTLLYRDPKRIQAWCHRQVVPATGRLRQQYGEFEASMGNLQILLPVLKKRRRRERRKNKTKKERIGLLRPVLMPNSISLLQSQTYSKREETHDSTWLHTATRLESTLHHGGESLLGRFPVV